MKRYLTMALHYHPESKKWGHTNKKVVQFADTVVVIEDLDQLTGYDFFRCIPFVACASNGRLLIPHTMKRTDKQTGPSIKTPNSFLLHFPSRNHTPISI